MSQKCDYRWRAVETMEGLRVYTVCITHDKETSFSMLPCEETIVTNHVLTPAELKKYPVLEEDDVRTI